MAYTDVWTEGLATIRKALTLANSGNALLMPIIDAVIPQMVDYLNPLRVNLPRKAGLGRSWTVNGSVGNAKREEWEAGKQFENCELYEAVEFLYKTVLMRGKAMRKLQSLGASFIDVLMEEIEGKIMQFKSSEIASYVKGNNYIKFDGIDNLCNLKKQIKNAKHKRLSLALLHKTISLNDGNVDMLVMSRRFRREVNGILQRNDLHIDVKEVNGGYMQMVYCGIPIYIGDCAKNSIYCIDSKHLFVGELTPVKMLPLAKITSQYDEFEIYCDETLVLIDPKNLSKLVNLYED